MSMNQSPAFRARSQPRTIKIACWSLVLAGLMWSDANAMTEGEKALANTPLPHEKLGAGQDSVRVHWVRLRGYVEGKDGHAARLNELKERFRYCAQLAQDAGRQVQAPQVWPDYVQSTQTDIYEAANRTIRYDTTLLYGVSPLDCSLTESRGVSAKLSSVKGACTINFTEKRADGVCDAKAHADAPLEGPFGPRRVTFLKRSNANDAQIQAGLAAAKHAMQQLGPIATGERKTIAGIECDVLTLKVGVDETECISRGGSFAGWHAPPGTAGAHIALESSWVGGMYMRAAKAQLDAKVNAAVFAPYLADGFQVNNIERRK